MGSTVLLVNSIIGPGFLVIPMVYQRSGWVVPTVIFVVMFVASSFSATFLTDTIARIPGNSRFERRIEFACIFEHYFGPRAKLVAQAMVLLCFLSQIITSIVAASQVLDSLIVALSPNSTTYALQVPPDSTRRARRTRRYAPRTRWGSADAGSAAAGTHQRRASVPCDGSPAGRRAADGGCAGIARAAACVCVCARLYAKPCVWKRPADPAPARGRWACVPLRDSDRATRIERPG